MPVASFGKGYITRCRITDLAKREFYNKGYDPITFTALCEELGMRYGNLSYYFHKKPDLAEGVILDFMVQVDQHIRYYFPEATLLQHTFMVSSVAYMLQLSDANRCRFIKQTLMKGLLPTFGVKSARSIYDRLNSQFKLHLTKEEIRLFTEADKAVRVELQLDLLRRTNMNPTREEILDMSLELNAIMGRIFKMPEDAIQDAIAYVRRHVDEVNTSRLIFLKY